MRPGRPKGGEPPESQITAPGPVGTNKEMSMNNKQTATWQLHGLTHRLRSNHGAHAIVKLAREATCLEEFVADVLDLHTALIGMQIVPTF